VVERRPLPHPELLAAIPRLRRYARVLAGDWARADDLVQETLARAWEKRRLWQPGTDLRAWMFTIMHNVFVNLRTSATARRCTSRSTPTPRREGAWQMPVQPQQFTHVELAELLQQVGRLPVEQRETLLLAAVEELKYEEIATMLSIPVGTVMSRLSRAREKLRRMADERPAAFKRVK
jgi:RNA polymerase sigma-70 factor (ECF subfamily)